MLRKIIPLLLCCLMLVACNNSAVTLLPFIDVNDTKIDYDGEVITAFKQSNMIWAYSDNNSPQAEALWKRIHDVEEKLNVKIEMSTKGEDGFRDYFMVNFAAGSAKVDLIYKSSGNDLWFLAEAGYLLPITDYPEYIDLSETDKYGEPGVLEAAMHNGIPYAVQPTYWPGLQGIECFFIAYNTDKFASNGISDLHEYYENRTWTWDTFKSVLTKVEPVVREDEYIFSSHGGYLMNTLFLSNGFDYVTFVDGVPTFDLSPKEALNAIEFYKELTEFGDKLDLDAGRWEYSNFANGNEFMTMTTAATVTTGTIAYGSVPYGIMPFPSGPDIEYGKWAQSVTRIYGLSIPISAKEPTVVAHVINELCEPMEEFGGSKEGLKQYYRDNVFSSDIDAEIYFDVERNVRYDYDDAGLIEEYNVKIAENLDVATPAELIQKNKNVVERIFTQYIEPNLTGYLIEHMNIE